jgi:uncharacterized protein YprB with RNaseH-like and TPR domain
MMSHYGILIEKLNTHGDKRLENGHKFLIKCIKTYTHMINFLRMVVLTRGMKIIKNISQYYLQLNNFLFKRKKLFKGIEDYSDVHRFVYDIETTGLDPNVNKIILIGVKDNRGYKKTIPAYGENGEKLCIIEFLNLLDY